MEKYHAQMKKLEGMFIFFLFIIILIAFFCM